MAACHRYIKAYPKRHVMFEYVMLKGINDSTKHAKEVITLLQGLSAKVNLIPFNPFPGTDYQTTPWTQVLDFQNRLMASGLQTNVRRTRGDDIDAACGQLAGEVADRTKRTAQVRQTTVKFEHHSLRDKR
jgi:23S rRNA (adenine2503-C2)-methyltransferase